MTTVGLRAPGISPATKCNTNRRPQYHASLSVFPLLSMKIEKPKPAVQTCSVSTSKWRVEVVGAPEIKNRNQELQPAPEVGVAVFILKDNKILFGRRRSLYVAANTYGLPAGHLELGETYEECAAREVKEETGLDIKNIELLTTNILYHNATHLHITYLRAHLSYPNQTPQNIEPDKCEGWEWYNLNNLPEPMFGPLREMLRGGFNPFASYHCEKPVLY
ncbi:hypothetical protein SSX86_025270 [Deinandra increscens subsp. villosa]|uniref:Nudix hydrolase domain-containing protein n=1 Tax=Deinandra increscens subsp. villosa TaxID=3103831 RepID=A0AAP0GMT5_9ASTR